MEDWWEIAGISLQITAGLFLILHQISDILDKIARWIRERLAILSGQRRSKGRFLILTSPIFLVTLFFILWRMDETSELTWSIIGGLVIWALIGYEVYLYSLGFFGKRLIQKGSYSDGLKALISQGKLTQYNLILLFMSSIWLVILILVIKYAYGGSSQNLLQQSLMLLYILVSSIIAFPIASLSFVNLLSELTLYFINLLTGVKGTHFWFFVLAVWLTGGGFLLVNAFSK